MLDHRHLPLFPVLCAAFLALGLVISEAEPTATGSTVPIGMPAPPKAAVASAATATPRTVTAPAPATVTETVLATVTETVTPTPTTKPKPKAKAKAKPKHKAKAKAKPKHKAKAKAKPKHKAKAKHKARTKAKPVTNAKIRNRVHPGYVTRGYYIRSLRGRSSDLVNMRRLGAMDGRRNPGGSHHLVLMDIGGQVHNGVFLSTTHRFISYRRLVRAMNAYVDGYGKHQRSHAPVIIAIGTNNDLRVSLAEGRAWARQVINPMVRFAKRYPNITIAGANDIEPGFSGSPLRTRQWLSGYLANTTAQFVFNGSADGCSSVHTFSRCNRGWTAMDLVRLAGGMAPRRILVLPQIYNETMAWQWARLASTAVKARLPRLRIIGPLTENVACGRDPYCPTMPSWQAFRRLMSRLHHVGLRPHSLPVQVDLAVR